MTSISTIRVIDPSCDDNDCRLISCYERVFGGPPVYIFVRVVLPVLIAVKRCAGLDNTYAYVFGISTSEREGFVH